MERRDFLKVVAAMSAATLPMQAEASPTEELRLFIKQAHAYLSDHPENSTNYKGMLIPASGAPHTVLSVMYVRNVVSQTRQGYPSKIVLSAELFEQMRCDPTFIRSIEPIERERWATGNIAILYGMDVYVETAIAPENRQLEGKQMIVGNNTDTVFSRGYL